MLEARSWVRRDLRRDQRRHFRTMCVDAGTWVCFHENGRTLVTVWRWERESREPVYEWVWTTVLVRFLRNEELFKGEAGMKFRALPFHSSETKCSDSCQYHEATIFSRSMACQRFLSHGYRILFRKAPRGKWTGYLHIATKFNSKLCKIAWRTRNTHQTPATRLHCAF